MHLNRLNLYYIEKRRKGEVDKMDRETKRKSVYNFFFLKNQLIGLITFFTKQSFIRYHHLKCMDFCNGDSNFHSIIYDFCSQNDKTIHVFKKNVFANDFTFSIWSFAKIKATGKFSLLL